MKFEVFINFLIGNKLSTKKVRQFPAWLHFIKPYL